MSKRGRPLIIDKSKVIELLIKYKNDVILDDGRIKSKCDKIWCTLSKEINDVMTPNALYTYVVCNKHNVHDKLMSSFPSAEQDESDIMKDEENSTSKNTSKNESSINESVATCDESYERILESRQETIFTINIPKSDFEALIIHKKYQRTEHKRRIIRHHTVLQPGMWQHVFCQKIWEATKLSCGFNFKNHKLTRDGQSGYANGTW